MVTLVRKGHSWLRCTFLKSQPLRQSSTDSRISQDTRLALIHIPISVYSHFISPILQLLLRCDHTDEDGDVVAPSKPRAYWHPFANISITPSECSIVCSREQAEDLFVPVLDALDPAITAKVSVSNEDYSVIMIGGEGLEAGQRVLDLTGPLALAGM